MNVRRSFAALTASAVLCAVAAPAAAAASESPKPSAKLPAGLFGSKDPTYDGVWRQSLALLAQDAAGAVPAKKAVDWLVGQQCDEGGFAAYRADAKADCDKKTQVDSNSTAIAVQALAALGGHDEEMSAAVEWLESVQNKDGGWGYMPGGPSDANSTSVVIGALTAADKDPEDVLAGKKKSPYDALLDLQLGCGRKASEQGAFAYQPDKSGKLAPNLDATAAAALAGLGKNLIVVPAGAKNEDVEPLDCGAADSKDQREPDEAAAGASYQLAAALKKDKHLEAVAPGADKPVPDHANTADAVIALAAGGHRDAARASLAWLEKNSAAWTKDNPAGIAVLVLAARAAGENPRAFGGTDLVRTLSETGPQPQSLGPASGTAGEADEEGTDSRTVWWLVGAGLIAGAGIGFVLTARKKKQ